MSANDRRLSGSTVNGRRLSGSTLNSLDPEDRPQGRRARISSSPITDFFVGIFAGIWWFLRAIITFVILFPIVVIMWIPWSLSWCGSCCRPHKLNTKGEYELDEKGQKVSMKYDKYDDHRQYVRDVFAPWGQGYEAKGMTRKDGSKRHAGWETWTWRFLTGRSWELYELLRECWQMLHRQGLQVAGYLSGLTILMCQVEMMIYDYHNKAIIDFVDSYYGGPGHDDPHALLTQADPLCPYIVGTGVANWSTNMENLVWYGFYHSMLGLLCVMLMIDEMFNVRVGLFAPQWSRMGNGFTITFLSAATLSSSYNYGFKRLVDLRYTILVVIFIGGVYNVARVLAAASNITGVHYADQSYRNRRHPLRPWTAEEWWELEDIPDFTERPPELPIKHWAERMQLKIGDQARAFQKIDREQWLFSGEAKVAQKVYEKRDEEWTMEEGQFGRKFIHGATIKFPPPNAQDLKDVKRYSKFKHYAPFYGKHWWDPWHQWDNPPAGMEEKYWRAKKRWTTARYWTFWFDIRRVHACACAVSAFGLHIGLMCDVFARSRWITYRAEYTEGIDAWRENHGPSGDACQYYSGTFVPKYIQLGTGSFRGVSAVLGWLGLWHVFIMGMCVAVFLVAFSNNRTFGMHLPWPVTLIGPRCSSNSIGWTLGFIAWATLQLGMFFGQPPIVLMIARAICYNCLISWVVYLGPNEPLGRNYVRRPFWKALSERAFVHMDSKKFHRDPHNFRDF